MGDKRQNNQLQLAFLEEYRGEAPKGLRAGTETLAAKRTDESPAIDEQTIEEVCERENCKQALKRVKANKGSPGVDGMTVQELPEYLKEHWPAIREQLLSGAYQPQPVKRVEIPKPDGGMRKLGIPTVLDRFIQQAVMQVLQRKWDRTFSEHSYGFRPGRSAHQAVEKAQQYTAEGYRWVVCFGSVVKGEAFRSRSNPGAKRLEEATEEHDAGAKDGITPSAFGGEGAGIGVVPGGGHAADGVLPLAG
jgi:RNA-directed DNA polymerase